MDTEERKGIDRRLARIEGQIRGVRRLIAEETYCCDVLNQITAVSSALDQVAASVASHHIKHCIVGHQGADAHPKSNEMSQEDLLDELDDVLKRLVR